MPASGQRFFVLFNVAAVTGVSQGYVMFTVSQYDSASYLFTTPTFISLDPTVKPDSDRGQGHTHRHQRHHPDRRPGVHTAQYDGDGGQLHGARARFCRRSAP